jgi:hypothetical protein
MFTALAISLLAFAGFVGLGFKQISDNHAQTNRAAAFSLCVANWANATAQRTARITQLSSDRSDALDVLLRAAASGNRDRTRKALAAYLKASNTYNNALATNPLPPAPRFACGSAASSAAGAASTPARIVVTVTPPPRTSTATRTVMRTVAVARPGALRTIVVPGPTQTQIRTRICGPPQCHP